MCPGTVVVPQSDTGRVQMRLVFPPPSWTWQPKNRAIPTGVDLLGQTAAVFKIVAQLRQPLRQRVRLRTNSTTLPGDESGGFPRFSDTDERV